jgi:hypothetical protein
MRRISASIAALVAATTAFGVTAGGAAAGSSPSGQPPTTCFWTDVVTRGVNNIDFPDTEASYWYARYRLPPGGKVVLRGEFPHARYMSFVSYSTVAGRSGSPTDHLTDASIKPDRGSLNPFAPWSPRFLPGRRSYTVTLSADAPPAPGQPREPNTLYTGRTETAGQAQAVEVILRIYTPDRSRNLTGDAGLPQPTYQAAGAANVDGQRLCDTLGTAGGKIPNVAIPQAQYNALLALSPNPTHPAVNPIHWDTFFNNPRLAEPFYRGTPAAALIPGLPTAKTGGFYSNTDNSYVSAYVDRSFGPRRDGHNILVLTGRMPTTPATHDRNAFARGDTQLRYWSLCQNESIASGRVSSECLYDETVPTDRDRRFTVVVSLPEDRPTNATRRCGVAWLDWGTTGDGFARPRGGLLAMRNMLPDPSFTHAPANVTVPGTEAQVMGDYLPTGTYTSKTAFERRRLGCR